MTRMILWQSKTEDKEDGRDGNREVKLSRCGRGMWAEENDRDGGHDGQMWI